jgi:hypothetical protein
MPGIWGQSAREKRVRWRQLARFVGDQRIALAGRSRFNDSGKRSSIASGREDIQNLRGARNPTMFSLASNKAECPPCCTNRHWSSLIRSGTR